MARNALIGNTFDQDPRLAFPKNMDYTRASLYQNGVLPVPGPRHHLPRILIMMMLLALAPGWLVADEVQLKADRPERYTVVKGDTLWTIAGRFLHSPWHWPRVWQINERIQNPHLIYPGDVIVLRYVDGRPELSVLRNEKLTPDAGTAPAAQEFRPPELVSVAADRDATRLAPRTHVTSLERAIPTIPPDIIVPFLTQPLAVDDDQLKRAGYVTTGLDNRIALGDQSEFYARGVKGGDSEYFQIFRPGKVLKNPDTGEVLGYEATYLGDARLLEAGDPTKLVVTSAKQEIVPTDRLLAASPRATLPYYYPHAPTQPVHGRVISALNAVAEVGPYTIVAVSVGKREGIEEGHVLRVLRHVGKHKDPVVRRDYLLPDEESALVLVFRTFDKVSYALVMNATRPVHLLDTVTTP